MVYVSSILTTSTKLQTKLVYIDIICNQLKLYIIKLTTNKYQIKKTINILTNNHYNIKSLNNKIIILSQYQTNKIIKLLNFNNIIYKITN